MPRITRCSGSTLPDGAPARGSRRLDLGIRARSGVRADRGPGASPFPNPLVQKEIGDVQSFRWLKGHGRLVEPAHDGLPAGRVAIPDMRSDG
jgi:hypothetical protein